MSTRWGQWLATNWAPAARLWRTAIELALLREAEEGEQVHRAWLLRELNALASADFKLSDETRHGLLRAWISWRNAAEHAHRQREILVGHRLSAPLELRGYPHADGIDR